MATSPDGADAAPGRSGAARPAGGRSRPYDLGPIAEPLTGHGTGVLVTTRTWGAFHGTDLDLRLRRRGVTPGAHPRSASRYRAVSPRRSSNGG